MRDDFRRGMYKAESMEEGRKESWSRVKWGTNEKLLQCVSGRWGH